MVRDSYAMRIAAQVLQHIFGTTKGTFQVDHPVLLVERSQPCGKDLGLRQKLQVCVEVELAILESLLESFDELTAKNFTQHLLGKKVVVSGTNPAGVIG